MPERFEPWVCHADNSVLDWGLQNNLFVLSNGRIRSRELFWGASRERTGQGVAWRDEVVGGGVYVTNSTENLNFPAATHGFLDALTASGRSYRKLEFREKMGRPYAEIFEIPPISLLPPSILRSDRRQGRSLNLNPARMVPAGYLAVECQS